MGDRRVSLDHMAILWARLRVVRRGTAPTHAASRRCLIEELAGRGGCTDAGLGVRRRGMDGSWHCSRNRGEVLVPS